MSDDAELYKIASAKYAEYFGDVRRHLSNEFSAEIRWVTASLFILNAGALAKIADAEPFELRHRIAGLAFWIGVALAFAYVRYSQAKTKKFMHLTQRLEELWILGATTGQPESESIKLIESERNAIKTSVAPWFSYGSFAMFTAGLGVMSCLT